MDRDQLLDKKESGSYKIFDDIAPSYDFLNHLLSMGIDKSWRRKVLKLLPDGENLKVLDVACGTGDLSIALSSSKKVLLVTGVDLSTKMLEVGRAKIEKRGLASRVKLKVGDGVNLNYSSEFDVVTVAFGIRNFSDVAGSLKSMHQALNIGGKVLIMEFSIPRSKLLKMGYLFYFRKLLPFVGNLISGHKDAYTYLNKTVEDFPYGESFLALMKEAGFKDLKAVQLTGGIATIYTGGKLSE